MRIPVSVALLCLAISGCDSTWEMVSADEQRARDMAEDSQRCQAAGFQAGSRAMADCMNTAAATRTADKNRDARNQIQQASLQQQDAAGAARRAADDAATQRRRDEFQRDFQRLGNQADAVGTIGSDSGDDVMGRGTAANTITGFDPGAANLTMCADGAMREDCADSPMGQ